MRTKNASYLKELAVQQHFGEGPLTLRRHKMRYRKRWIPKILGPIAWFEFVSENDCKAYITHGRSHQRFLPGVKGITDIFELAENQHVATAMTNS